MKNEITLSQLKEKLDKLPPTMDILFLKVDGNVNIKKPQIQTFKIRPSIRGLELLMQRKNIEFWILKGYWYLAFDRERDIKDYNFLTKELPNMYFNNIERFDKLILG